MTVPVVDDVADSGRTLELVMDFCRDHVATVRSAVLYEKPTTIVAAD
jgi:hypoxanthine phosphoribosyltransferase